MIDLKSFCVVTMIVLMSRSLKCEKEDSGYISIDSDNGSAEKRPEPAWLRSLKSKPYDLGSGHEEEEYEASGQKEVINDHPDCERMTDLAFILDSSESIGPVNFRAIKTYTKTIVQNLDLTKCDNVGVVKFTDYANSETYLGTHQSTTDVIKRIDALEGPAKYLPSEINKSRIDVALLVADEIVFTKQFGLRESSEKFLVVMTDGLYTKPYFQNQNFTSGEAVVKKLTKKGIRILVLVIGENASIPDILKIVSSERDIFPERRLDDLQATLLSKKPSPGSNNIANEFLNTTEINTQDGLQNSAN